MPAALAPPRLARGTPPPPEVPPPEVPPAAGETPERGPAARPASPPAAGPRDRLTLHGADWGLYVKLSDEPANARYKFTFDGPRGLLEIEMPQGKLHESVSRLVSLLVAIFSIEREIDIEADGAISLRHPDLDRGADCDESFYVSGYAAMRAWEAAHPDRPSEILDLAGGEPPPDLVVEVDVTSPGINKLPIYAAMGVPEVWVWADGSFTVYRRTSADTYEEVAESVELPGFPLAAAGEAVLNRRGLSIRQIDGEFRDLLRAAG